jgi:vancomycin permeability regulator SanA
MRKLKIVLCICISWFIIHILIVSVDGLIQTEETYPYGVILGNKVNEDGTLSERLKARVDKGLEVYQKGRVGKLVVSGGFGKEGHFEAEVMAQYLISKGVHSDDIIIDNEGNNSWLSATNFTKRLPQTDSVLVISQYYHITRSKLAFRKAGVKHAEGAAPNYFQFRDLYALFREFFAFYKYLLVY